MNPWFRDTDETVMVERLKQKYLERRKQVGRLKQLPDKLSLFDNFIVTVLSCTNSCTLAAVGQRAIDIHKLMLT